MMTVRQAVAEGTGLLKNEVETPMLDAILILSEVTGLSKERLLASYPDDVSGQLQEQFRNLIDLRLGGQPVSYIIGRKEFYSLVFKVDARALVPRPDTETLVDAVIDLARSDATIKELHDCCTGSGCIGITLKHELPAIDITVSDISSDALSLFRENSLSILGQILPFCRSDLLESVPGAFDVIVANPPYLTTEQIDTIEAEGWPEPMLALDGGVDGLDFYRISIPQSLRLLRPGGHLFLESSPDQLGSIEKMLVQNGFSNTIIYRDLGERNRVIRAEG